MSRGCHDVGVLYADHVRFHSCHPYLYRVPTDTLIIVVCMSSYKPTFITSQRFVLTTQIDLNVAMIREKSINEE